jgi:hypothetical protein
MSKFKLTVLIACLMILTSCQGQSQTPSIPSAIELTPKEQEFILTALEDEYKAEATYAAIIAKFGEIKPFTNIINAEEKHSSALVVLLNKFNIEAPSINEFNFQIPDFESPKSACAAGVQAEIENIALYDKMLPQITNPAIVSSFEKLRRASEENHLPAFQRCAN